MTMPKVALPRRPVSALAALPAAGYLPPVQTDTDPEVERIRDRLLTTAGPARRFQLMGSLTESVIEMSRAALRRRHPQASAADLDLRFVALCYGQDLADRLEVWLHRRQAP